MDLVFGKGGFILSLDDVEILNNRTGSIKDLSDIQSDLTEFISDEKNIADESSGEYWNPDLLIKNCTADEWNDKFKNLLGAVVGFTPFSDNTAFSFDCTSLKCYPVWVDNKHWKCDVKIKLASVLPVIPAVYFSGSTLMWIGFTITPPVEPNSSLMWIGETIPILAPTITKVDNTIVME